MRMSRKSSCARASLRWPSCVICVPSSCVSTASSRSCACAIWTVGSRIVPVHATETGGEAVRHLLRSWLWRFRRSDSTASCRYGVAARINQFGIRMALGASGSDVVEMVLSGTAWNVGIGLLAGVLLCLIFDKVASEWVTESARDPVILGSVIAVLSAVAVAACLAPARRAAFNRPDGRGAPPVGLSARSSTSVRTRRSRTGG